MPVGRSCRILAVGGCVTLTLELCVLSTAVFVSLCDVKEDEMVVMMSELEISRKPLSLIGAGRVCLMVVVAPACANDETS